MKSRMNSDPYKKPYKSAIGSNDPIHWSTKFGRNVTLGEGVIIEEGCKIGNSTFIGHYTILRPDTKIGNNCRIGHLTVFEGNCIIGDRVLIHAQCHITKGVKIEDDVFIAPFFCGANTQKIKHGRNFDLEIDGYTIKRAARIGIGVLVLPGKVIGENAQVGVGAVVTKDIPSKEIWVGNPAKKLKDVPEDELL